MKASAMLVATVLCEVLLTVHSERLGVGDVVLTHVKGSEMTLEQRQAAAQLVYDASGQSGSTATVEELVERLAASPAVVLAQKSGEILGLTTLKNLIGTQCPMSESGFLAVHPSLRGQGVGRRLSDAVALAAQDLRLSAVYGNTQVVNYPSLMLQQKTPGLRVAGFIKVGELKTFVSVLFPGPGTEMKGDLFNVCQAELLQHLSSSLGPKGMEVSDSLDCAQLRAEIAVAPAELFRKTTKEDAEQNIAQFLGIEGC